MTINSLVNFGSADDLDRLAEEAAASELSDDDRTFSLTTLAMVDRDEFAKREREVLTKYRDLIKDLTREEELDVLGLTLKQAFPPLERDVEKLIIDLNLIVYQYMQQKLEADKEVRVETIRSTVATSLRKVSAALLTIVAEDKS
jgi:hypothetical protein